METNYRTLIAKELFGTTPNHLGSYFKVYDSLLRRNEPFVLEIEQPESGGSNPITSDDILLAARTLQDDPTLTLAKTMAKVSTQLGYRYTKKQLETSVLIAAQAMFMLDCAASRSAWQPDESFIGFFNKCFPRELGEDATVRKIMEDIGALKAWKLRARCSISFRGTDNLANHLLLDRSHPGGPTLYIFRCTAFLKAQMSRVHRGNFGKEDEIESCLKRGCLPSRLVAETLHSIRVILFHFDDPRSNRILERLITKGEFDEDCAQPEGYGVFGEDGGADRFAYVFWGRRLAEIHAFVSDRPPRNKFERWVKWQTSESNAFIVALAALLISIVVGILSLGLAVLQSWIAWKAWKDPIPADDADIVAKLQELMELIRQQNGR